VHGEPASRQPEEPEQFHNFQDRRTRSSVREAGRATICSNKVYYYIGEASPLMLEKILEMGVMEGILEDEEWQTYSVDRLRLAVYAYVMDSRIPHDILLSFFEDPSQ